VGEPPRSTPCAEHLPQIGIAIYPEDGSDFDGLLQKADTAMYNAKDAGRNTWRFFNDQMNQQAHEHLLLQNRHRALFGQFHRYQPQLESAAGGRWRRCAGTTRSQGVVPTRFVQAEDSGLIVPIGAWVAGSLPSGGMALAGWRNRHVRQHNRCSSTVPDWSRR
jgi:predicted signal transduction protein with EAL and GGDEF domain